MKVSLLGDSIRWLGYGNKVAELLGDKVDVFQPNDNCRYAKYTLRGLFEWADEMKGSEIVHWNNGMWDITRIFDDGLFTPEEEYVENMLRIADILKSRHKTVIFATTTPIKSFHENFSNDDIKRYNKIIVPELEKRGVIINDLHSLLEADTEKYICDDKVHLSEEGIEVCTEQVVRMICDFL